jgi:hypothetical protein
LLAATLVLVLGLSVRFSFVPPWRGGTPAMVMLVLLAVGAWSAGWLLASARGGFFATLVVVVLHTLAALPPRGQLEYDDRIALYRTDQSVVGSVVVSGAARQPALTLLAEPTSSHGQLGLAGEVAGRPYAWNCPVRPGIQHLVLPLRSNVPSGESIDVWLRLTGAPSRETDYVLVYTSAQLPGPVMSVVDGATVDDSATRCSLM